MNRPVVLIVVMSILAGALAFVVTLVSAPEPFDQGEFGARVRESAADHRWARVAAIGRAAARQAPRSQEVLLFWALGEERSGNPSRAAMAWERLLRVTQENLDRGNLNSQQWYYRGWALHGLGDHEGARSAWEANAERTGPGELLYNQVCYLALAGRREDALAAWEQLSRSREVLRGSFSPTWARVDPDLDSIRDDPRFQAALERAEQRIRRQQEREVPV